jgi:hypothetical protein
MRRANGPPGGHLEFRSKTEISDLRLWAECWEIKGFMASTGHPGYGIAIA